MHERLSLKDLLLAGVPCSTSSFQPTSRTALNREIGASEPERENSSNLADHYVRTRDSAEGTVGVSENNRKRKGKAPGVRAVSDEVKKFKKVEASLLMVVENSWLLVGRLLLWNRTISSHPGTGSNSLDCLAFCDGSSSVCCTVQRLGNELLGQYVQVNSWTFVPAVEHSERQCNGKDGSTVSDAVGRLKRTECSENPKLEDVKMRGCSLKLWIAEVVLKFIA